MTQDYFLGIWKAMAPALGNHLWQSTLFAAAVWLLTFFWRKSQARERYWLWLAASLKFLIPFSLLVALGGRLAPPQAHVDTQARLYWAMEEIGQPFAPAKVAAMAHATPAVASPGWTDQLPIILSALWIIGMAAVLLVWCLRWRRISAVVREAEPLHQGREVEALRHLENKAAMKKPLAVLLCRSSMEPGAFGILRPVLLWPAGISDRLEDTHLEAILSHELWHVRRRDNLAAAIHMLVQAVFWFHPLVWWLGARLVEERERACDEEVLALGNHRQAYAESILKTCEFCVEAPLACISGVTGADLKERIARIMTERVVEKLEWSRRLFLTAAGVLAIAAPVVFGLLNTSKGSAQSTAQSAPTATFEYEVASIKPNKSDSGSSRFMFSPDSISATNVSLRLLFRNAYGVQDHQLAGLPSWIDSEKYDVEAKMDPSVADQLGKLRPDEYSAARQSMLQALLADRLKLTVRRESKDLPIYALVVAKNGPKLLEAKPGDSYSSGIKGPNGAAGTNTFRMARGELTGQGVPMTDVVRLLTQQLHRSVVDKTGLTGKYDFTLKWTPDDNQVLFKENAGPAPTDNAATSDSSGPSIFTAIQEQLGLKLEQQKGPVEIIVVDHVEKPSAN
jgi:uncharacterized protein (TIGR03435 family)